MNYTIILVPRQQGLPVATDVVCRITQQQTKIECKEGIYGKRQNR